MDGPERGRTYVFAVVVSAPDYAGVLAIEELQTGITAVYEHA